MSLKTFIGVSFVDGSSDVIPKIWVETHNDVHTICLYPQSTADVQDMAMRCQEAGEEWEEDPVKVPYSANRVSVYITRRF